MNQNLFDSNGASIRSVAKALSIVNVLAKFRREMALSEIAREMNLAKSTVYGLLATLRDFGFVEQSSFSGKYRLGIRLFELGNVVANSWDLNQVARPFIQALVDELGETAHLVILDKGQVLYVDKREGNHSFRISVSQVGSRLPAHCTGVGKALLAYLSPAEVRQIVKTRGMVRFTKNTITEVKLLEQELVKVREQGYAEDYEEVMESLCCVAAPIRDHSGKVCAAVSVAGPVSRLHEENHEQAVRLVTETAAKISAGLGYVHTGKGGE